MDSKDVKDVRQRWKRLVLDRRSWEPAWKSIARLMLPYAGRWENSQYNDGEKRGEAIVDSHALRCAKNLAAFLFTGMASPSHKWFKLSLSDDALGENAQVKRWLEVAEDRMYEAFNRSNFYLEIHKLFEELGIFGSTCMFMGDDPVKFFNCKTFTIGQFWIDVNADGEVDTVFREFPMTARQIAQAFGESELSPGMKSSINSSGTQTWKILHAVYPNTQYDPKKADSKSFAFTSVYLDNTGDGRILRHGGFQEMPYMCPRWSVVGENSYGQSPGFDALSEVRQLQVERTDRLDAVQKIINPPLVAPEGYTEDVDVTPGAINPMPTGAGDAAIKPLYEVNWNVAAVVNEMADARQAVSQLFFNDLVLMQTENPNMTATEVMERKQEKMLMLGPIVERLQSELLGPIIDRAFAILTRMGALPSTDELPEGAAGQGIKVEYISPLAQAQRKTGLDAISATVQFALAAAQGDPTALDRVDMSEAVQRYAELVGAPGSIVRSDDEVAAIRQQRQQAQAQAAKAQAMQQGIPAMADALSKASNVDMEKNTLASQLMGGGNGQDKPQ